MPRVYHIASSAGEPAPCSARTGVTGFGGAVAAIAMLSVLLTAGCGDGGAGPPPTSPTPPPTPTPPTPTPPTPPEPPPPEDPFAWWNTLPPEPWWRESAPYSCVEEENPDSPWLAAGLPDPGGSDPLSLIRFYGNGSYLRYGNQGFEGCTKSTRHENGFLQDPPADPTFFSIGDVEILVDIARIPPDATGWFQDDGSRLNFSMSDAVALLNRYITPYFRRISDDQFRLTFRAGEEFEAPDDGSPWAARLHQYNLVGACVDGCQHGSPGGLNRVLLDDVASHTGGSAWNGAARFGLAAFAQERMGTVVHEIGHGWMRWPHPFAEVPWAPYGGDLQPPNPYSNNYDIMSESSYFGWDVGMVSTAALNRYTAGWIRPEEVALHLEERGVYTLVRPRERGHQLLVVNSGRRHAFTTLEVLEEFSSAYRIPDSLVYDPSAPGDRRPLRYEGVLVSRYDQTAGTGTRARFGPALHNADNPEFLEDVGFGYDDHSLIPDGESRDIGGGVTVRVSRNRDGSYEVSVTGGRTAAFEPWCYPLWFASPIEYDVGCFLDAAVWE